MNDIIDWNRLKIRILRDLEDGKTRDEVRKGLAEDPDDTLRISISKSQLETKLNHWGYRGGLHKSEWEVVHHRINKRRLAGKPSSQVVVNGFVFSERKVAKAIKRYDTPKLAKAINRYHEEASLRRSPSPQIPPELRQHHIEVRTPPLVHRPLQSRAWKHPIATAAQNMPALQIELAGRVWPQNKQWKIFEESIQKFAERVFIPAYTQDDRFRGALMKLGLEHQISRTRRNALPAYSADIERLPSRPDQTWDPWTDSHHDTPIHQSSIVGTTRASSIHTAVVETLVHLLYDLSHNHLAETGRKNLAFIIDAPAWDIVFPDLRDLLVATDANIVHAIAEGLLQESLAACHSGMLDLSIALGADPLRRRGYFDARSDRRFHSTLLVAACHRCEYGAAQASNKERFILSVLRRDPCVTDIGLMWIIKTGHHSIAETIIRDQPERKLDFTIPLSHLEGAFWYESNTPDPISPLVLACSGKKSVEKLSLIRCLLERNVKADLLAIIASVKVNDSEIITLLHQHGAPVNGFGPHNHTPLSTACELIRWGRHNDSTCISLLLSLGASPGFPTNAEHVWYQTSPLHILCSGGSSPVIAEALCLLLKYGADVNFRVNYPFSFSESSRNALEHAINSSQWKLAVILLSAGCELTGKELRFIGPKGCLDVLTRNESASKHDLRQFVHALLAKQPWQEKDLHRNWTTILRAAIRFNDSEMILALLDYGVPLTHLDLQYMLFYMAQNEDSVCDLPSRVQMQLAFAGGSSQLPITAASTLRLILAFFCPEVVRRALDGCPNFYDSKGLCYLIVRVLSKDRISYNSCRSFEVRGAQQPPATGTLDLDDLRGFVSRRTILNSHQDWDSTALAVASRAGRADIVRMILGCCPDISGRSAPIPSCILQNAVWFNPLRILYQQNSESLGIWIKYCPIDDAEMRYSLLTAAAMVVPETASEELIDVLLTLNYEPDSWTVLIAASKGHLSTLQRLERLDCWSRILNHKCRPDWCPTALQVAIQNNHLQTARFLLNAGFKINEMDQPPSRPFRGALTDQRCVYDSAFTAESDTILPGTALQHAVGSGDMELVALLIDAGADVNAPAATHSGATALQIATIQGSTQMVEYLISIGANPYAPGAEKGRTALQIAAGEGYQDVVEMILAQPRNRKEIVEAVFFAERNEHLVVARILRERLQPQWCSEDTELLAKMAEDWEGTEIDDIESETGDRNNLEEGWPESLGSRESTPNYSYEGSKVCQVEGPPTYREDQLYFPQELEGSLGIYSGMDPTLPVFEEDDVDEMLLGMFV